MVSSLSFNRYTPFSVVVKPSGIQSTAWIVLRVNKPQDHGTHQIP